MSVKYHQFYKTLPEDKLYKDNGVIYTGALLNLKYPSFKVNSSMSDEEYLNYILEHPTELDEVTVTAPSTKTPFDRLIELAIAGSKLANENYKNNLYSISNPIFGDIRTLLYNKALEEDPNFSNNWDMVSNIEEHINASTGGLLNRLSPTQNARLLYDWYNGKSINPFDYNSSWWGNSGIIPNDFALKYPWSMALNGIIDGATIFGINKGIKYANTSYTVGGGAETPIIKSKRFSPYVYKYSYIEPLEMKMRNNIPYFAKSKYIGLTTDGLNIYRLPKVIMPKDPTSQFRQIVKDLTHKYHYRPFKHEFLQGLGIKTPDGYVLSDFGINGAGQIGKTRFLGKPRIIDMAVETEDDFNAVMEGW